jgi:hypothetical protein
MTNNLIFSVLLLFWSLYFLCILVESDRSCNIT